MKTLAFAPPKTAPKYELLAAQLRAQIERGELKPSDQLPPFSEMREQHGISQGTLERAYGLLEQDGLVTRQQGRGTFVAQFKASVSGRSDNGWLQETIAVLTRCPQSTLNAISPNQGGLEWLTLGAMAGIEQNERHLLILRPERFGRQVEQLTQNHPYGLIVTDLGQHTAEVSSLVMALNRARVPIVCYGSSPNLSCFDRVTSDHEAGGYAIARWLIEQGRKRIAMVSAARPHNDYWFSQRRAGYERALRESGLEPLPVISIPAFQEEVQDRAEFEARVAQVALALIAPMTSATSPDALMFNTDPLTCYGAAALRMFHRVPNQDVALTGYDNCWQGCRETAFETVGPLITADKMNARMGELLVELLGQRVEGELPDEPQTRVLPPRVITIGDDTK